MYSIAVSILVSIFGATDSSIWISCPNLYTNTNISVCASVDVCIICMMYNRCCGSSGHLYLLAMSMEHSASSVQRQIEQFQSGQNVTFNIISVENYQWEIASNASLSLSTGLRKYATWSTRVVQFLTAPLHNQVWRKSDHNIWTVCEWWW